MLATTVNSRPIFIVGMNGSGTSMLLNCLNAHSEIYGFQRETRIIPYYASRLSTFGDLRDSDNFKSLWDDFRSQSCFRWVNHGTAPPLPEYWQERAHTLTTVIDETLGYFAREQGKQRWCEKTPMHAQHISVLHELFPNACFIHMIRDGRSCAASFHRRWGYIPQRTVYRWKHVIKAARQQARKCGANYIEIFYERLTDNPESEMHSICEFIGVAYEEGVLTLSRKPTHTGSMADTIVKSVPRWNTYFSEQQVRSLEAIAGRTLDELGYKVEQVYGNDNPSPFIMLSWRVRDYLRMGVSAIWDEFATPEGRKWVDLRGRIQSAIRQLLTSRF